MYQFKNQYTKAMAPDRWMMGTQMKPNSPERLLNPANLNSFPQPGLLVHQKYFFHLELLAGATSEEQFLYNLEEKTTFKLKLISERCLVYFPFPVILNY